MLMTSDDFGDLTVDDDAESDSKFKDSNRARRSKDR